MKSKPVDLFFTRRSTICAISIAGSTRTRALTSARSFSARFIPRWVDGCGFWAAAGSALPHRVAEFFNDIGIPLLEGYGLTEAAPVLCVARPDETKQVGAVGRPLNGVEIKLMPATGSIGEIVAHGPNVMAGYYRNEAATAEVLRDGWLHTGDLGRFDDDGRLYIVGRAKEVIVDSGGNNIYIEELEEIYGRSEFVKEMAVAGLKVGQGEQVAPLVVLAYARGESRRAVEDRLD